MPKVEFKGREGDGAWKPLPNGTYTIMFDTVEETMSSNDNPQLKLGAHVVGGPHDAKKVTLWYAATAKSLWKLEALLEAAGVACDKIDLGSVDSENGKPEYNLSFDTDDIPGCEVTYDVTEDEYNGKPKNNFNNERAPGNGVAAAAPAAPAEAPAAAAGAPAPAAAAAAPAGRRRRL